MRITFNSSRKDFLLLLGYALTFLNIALIAIANLTSILSYSYTIILFLVINHVVSGKNFLLKNYLVLQIYVLFAILLYVVQLLIMPDWNGFSGMYGGVGTDDSRFYAGIADNISSIPLGARGYIGMDHSFVTFLAVLYPFKVYHPLSIIIPNLLGISFIPYFTQKVSLQLTADSKVARIAFLLVLFCPVILSNGLILMRDGWSAFLLIAGVYYLIEKKIYTYIIVLAVLSFIRLGSGLLLVTVSLFYFWELLFSGTNLQKTLKIGALLIFIIIFFGLGLPLIIEYLMAKGVTGISRQAFVETFIKSADSKSIIYSIYTMPIYLKLPIGFIFFFLLPFLSFHFFTEGILNIRSILFTTIMPILSLIYFKYIISGIVFFFKNNNIQIKRFFYVYCLLLLIISQISIQPRHKTTIMPLFYILVAYGIFNNNKISRQLGIAFAIVLSIVQLGTLL